MKLYNLYYQIGDTVIEKVLTQIELDDFLNKLPTEKRESTLKITEIKEKEDEER